MMIDARMEKNLRQKLWTEETNMATDLDNILVTNENNKNAYELFLQQTKSIIYF